MAVAAFGASVRHPPAANEDEDENVIQVAKLTLSVDPAQQVRRAIGRVALSELDARRGTAHPSGGGGVNLYLMSPLEGDDVPELAIDLIKRTVGAVFRTHKQRMQALFRSGSSELAPWALLESQGNQVRLRSAGREEALHYLTAFSNHVGGRAASQLVRILFEFAPPAGEREASLASLEQSLEELAPPSADAAAAESDAPASLRDEILATTLTAQEVLQRVHGRAEDAKSWASRERRRDHLFGVWSSRGREFVHPDFQFDGSQLHPYLPELLKVLRTRVGFDPMQTDKGGWARAYWLYSPHPGLSAQALAAEGMDFSDPVTASMTLGLADATPRTPAAMFAREPEAVIALAKELAGAPRE